MNVASLKTFKYFETLHKFVEKRQDAGELIN